MKYNKQNQVTRLVSDHWVSQIFIEYSIEGRVNTVVKVQKRNVFVNSVEDSLLTVLQGEQEIATEVETEARFDLRMLR